MASIFSVFNSGLLVVASLIVMVMISGYENFVSRFDEADAEVSFLGKLDAGSLKIKVASSIVAISSIQLIVSAALTAVPQLWPSRSVP